MASKKDLRQNAYAQMKATTPTKKGFQMPFTASADESPLPIGVTPEQNKMLLEKQVPRGMEQGGQSAMGRPDLQPQGQIINDTAQKLVENRKAKETPKDPGIDWGAIGKGGLDLLGQGADALSKVPTSSLMGIAAGTEAGSRDPNTFLASGYGAKSGELAGREMQQSQLEAQRKQTAAQQAAENAFRQSSLDLQRQQLEASKAQKETEEQRRQQEMIEKNVDAIADTLTPADAQKLRGLPIEIKAQVIANPNLVKEPGFFGKLQARITGTKGATIIPEEFKKSTENTKVLPPPPQPKSQEDIDALKAARLI